MATYWPTQTQSLSLRLTPGPVLTAGAGHFPGEAGSGAGAYGLSPVALRTAGTPLSNHPSHPSLTGQPRALSFLRTPVRS